MTIKRLKEMSLHIRYVFILSLFLVYTSFTETAEAQFQWLRNLWSKDEPQQTPIVTTEESYCIETAPNKALVPIADVLRHEDSAVMLEMNYQDCDKEVCGTVRSCRRCRGRRTCYTNNYIENRLDPSFDNQNIADLNNSIDPRCTYRALNLEFAKRNQRFVMCTDEDSPKLQIIDQPSCLSKRLHHSMHSALTEIASCFSLDPKTLFTLFINEGGLHPHKQSPTGAVGPGQLTGSFIQHYNNNNRIFPSFEVYKKEIFPLTPNCQAVLDKIKDFDKMTDQPMCQRTNYYMNMVYTAMGFADYINKLVPIIMRENIYPRDYRISRNTAFEPILDYYDEAIRSNQLYRNTSNVREFKRRRRVFENLALFQGMNTNDRNLITEVAFYAHNHPGSVHLLRTYQRTQGGLGRDNFEGFTGSNGYWRRFLRKNRGLISENENRQNEIINNLYGPRTNGELAKSQIRVIEEGHSGDLPKIECGPY